MGRRKPFFSRGKELFIRAPHPWDKSEGEKSRLLVWGTRVGVGARKYTFFKVLY